MNLRSNRNLNVPLLSYIPLETLNVINTNNFSLLNFKPFLTLSFVSFLIYIIIIIRKILTVSKRIGTYLSQFLSITCPVRGLSYPIHQHLSYLYENIIRKCNQLRLLWVKIKFHAITRLRFFFFFANNFSRSFIIITLKDLSIHPINEQFNFNIQNGDSGRQAWQNYREKVHVHSSTVNKYMYSLGRCT